MFGIGDLHSTDFADQMFRWLLENIAAQRTRLKRGQLA
jgi:hypothetical protein